MANAANSVDPLERACALVGRFQYHFSRVEQKIDEAIIKLLDLDEKAGQIVTGSVDFLKKVNLVRTSASQQLTAEQDKKFAEDTCKRVFAINDKRQDVIHSSFEPVGDDVQFWRIVARGGNVRVFNVKWTDKDFEEQWAEMKELEAALSRLILMIKPLPPMDWYTPFQDMYYPRRSAIPAGSMMEIVQPPLTLRQEPHPGQWQPTSEPENPRTKR